MKNHGITRRIDNLGRIVIPKEIRKVLRINDGELLELYSNEDVIFIKKHKVIKQEDLFLYNYVKEISKILNCDVLLTDKESVIFSSNSLYTGKKLLNKGNKILSNLILNDNLVLSNVIPNGDLVGYLIFNKIKEEDKILINNFSSIVNKYFE